MPVQPTALTHLAYGIVCEVTLSAGFAFGPSAGHPIALTRGVAPGQLRPGMTKMVAPRRLSVRVVRRENQEPVLFSVG